MCRFWHDREGKPHRYWELIKVHGELAPLADVDLSAPPEKVSGRTARTDRQIFIR